MRGVHGANPPQIAISPTSRSHLGYAWRPRREPPADRTVAAAPQRCGVGLRVDGSSHQDLGVRTLAEGFDERLPRGWTDADAIARHADATGAVVVLALTWRHSAVGWSPAKKMSKDRFIAVEATPAAPTGSAAPSARAVALGRSGAVGG